MSIERRLERKVPIDAAGLLAFRAWHIADGAEFRKAHPTRRVHSLYFDSPALDDYADNLDGVSARTKLRLRWYGDTLTPPELRVEVKSKRAGASSKEFASIPTPPSFGHNLRRLGRELRRIVPVSLRPHFDAAPHPTLWNTYEREYFATRDGLRLTVDTELRAADLMRGRLDPRRLRPGPVQAVIELKLAASASERARELLASLPLPIAKHSKYTTGVGSLPF